MVELKKNAFSLLEIVVALALFGSVLLVFLEIFPQLYRLRSRSEQAVHELFIAESILNILKATAPQGVLAIGPDWKNNPSDLLVFSLKEPSMHVIAYDCDAQPRRLATTEECSESLQEKESSFLARVIITPLGGSSAALSQVDVIMIASTSSSEKERPHVESSLLLSTLPRYESVSE